MNATAEKTLAELQAAVDAASAAFGGGMHDYEVGRISPAEFGQLKRRMKKAEKALQEAKGAVTVTEPQLRALRKMAEDSEGSIPIFRIDGRMVDGYRVARSLEAKGLVTRTNAGRDSNDYLHITEAGRAALAAASRPV